MDDQDRQLAEALQDELGTMRAPEDLKARTLAAMKAARDEAVAVGVTADATTGAVQVDTKTAAAEINPEVKGGVRTASTASLANASAEPTHAKVIAMPKPKAQRGRRGRMGGRFIAALVACCCLLFVGGGGTYVYATPTAYVNFSVDNVAGGSASATGATQTEAAFIELVLNRFNRVVGATAVNDQAQVILDASNVKHKDYTDAVAELLSQAESQGVIIEGDSIAISVACDNAAQGAGLAESSNSCVSAAGCNGSASQTSVAERARTHEGSGSGNGSELGNGQGSGSGSSDHGKNSNN